MRATGTLIISLDFELFWGVRDHSSVKEYGGNVLGARRAIPAMLQLFKEYGIHATWATVGFLFFDCKSDLLASCPVLKPHYLNKALSPYDDLLIMGQTEKVDPYRFGKSLLDLVRGYPGQEIASHTFSHYYCAEPGQNEQSFRADMEAAVRAAGANGIKLDSLVFPRNQTRQEYLRTCLDLGIQCYRGTEKRWFYRSRSTEDDTPIRRVFRLIDSYINVSGHNTYPIPVASGMVNLPSSRFLRPFNPKLAWADPIRKRRIEDGIRHAAKNAEIFHLWWHPHNFGAHLENNLGFLRSILDCFAEMNFKYRMESLNMAEVAARVRHA